MRTDLAAELPARVYFNVVDQEGTVHPAVEYWAATLSEGGSSEQSLAPSRFVKLLGCNEALLLDGETFRGCRTGRTYRRGVSLSLEGTNDDLAVECTSLE